MATFDWALFLRDWSREIVAWDELARRLPLSARASGWLGFPGATDAQILGAEERLGTRLPPSYRAFLSVTNGWLATGLFISRLWSTQEIDWFRVRNQEWIEDWNRGGEYYDLRAPQPPVPDPRDERPDLPFTLEISDVGDSAIYLLNPRTVTTDGEWEAWFFSNWNPGAIRHRSFQEMMVAECESFRYVRDHRR